MRKLSYKIISLILAFTLFFQQTGLAQLLPQPLPVPPQLPVLRYLSVNTANPSNYFNFLMDRAQGLSPEGTVPNLDSEAKKLISYFFLGLTLPSESFWVNLKPQEPERITSEELSKTDLGRTLLEQDLKLKKDMANYLHPKNPQGKLYWERLYQALEHEGRKASATNRGGPAKNNGWKKATITSSSRVWIVPAEAVVLETEDGALVAKATLKVLLESEYLSLKEKRWNKEVEAKSEKRDEIKHISESLMKEIILPALTKEINESPGYAPLRQVYHSLILAEWFKRKQSGSRKGQEPNTYNLAPNNPYSKYINSGTTTGLESALPWEKQAIWQDYLKSYQEGEYKLQDTIFGLKRMYFSGGILFDTSNFPIVSSPLTSNPSIKPSNDAALIINTGGKNNIAGNSKVILPQKKELEEAPNLSKSLPALGQPKEAGASKKTEITAASPVNNWSHAEYFNFSKKMADFFDYNASPEDTELWFVRTGFWFGTNEASWAASLNEIEKRGGVYLGVAYGGQNLSRIARGKFEMGIIIDVNPFVTEIFMPIRAALISMSGSRAEYLALISGLEFTEEEIKELHDATLEEIHSIIIRRSKKITKEAIAKRMSLLWSKIESQFPEEIRNSAKKFWNFYSPWGFGLERMIVPMKTEGSWLSNEENFNRVKRMTVEGRILGVRGDWSSKEMIEKLQGELIRRNLKVSVVYLSNVEEDRLGRLISIRKNILMLPLAEDAIRLENISGGETRIEYIAAGSPAVEESGSARTERGAEATSRSASLAVDTQKIGLSVKPIQSILYNKDFQSRVLEAWSLTEQTFREARFIGVGNEALGFKFDKIRMGGYNHAGYKDDLTNPFIDERDTVLSKLKEKVSGAVEIIDIHTHPPDSAPIFSLGDLYNHAGSTEFHGVLWQGPKEKEIFSLFTLIPSVPKSEIDKIQDQYDNWSNRQQIDYLTTIGALFFRLKQISSDDNMELRFEKISAEEIESVLKARPFLTTVALRNLLRQKTMSQAKGYSLEKIEDKAYEIYLEARSYLQEIKERLNIQDIGPLGKTGYQPLLDVSLTSGYIRDEIAMHIAKLLGLTGALGDQRNSYLAQHPTPGLSDNNLVRNEQAQEEIFGMENDLYKEAEEIIINYKLKDSVPFLAQQSQPTGSPLEGKPASSAVEEELEKAKQYFEEFNKKFGVEGIEFGGVKELNNPKARAEVIDNKIYVNLGWIDKMPLDEIERVIAHEIQHTRTIFLMDTDIKLGGLHKNTEFQDLQRRTGELYDKVIAEKGTGIFAKPKNSYQENWELLSLLRGYQVYLEQIGKGDSITTQSYEFIEAFKEADLKFLSKDYLSEITKDFEPEQGKEPIKISYKDLESPPSATQKDTGGIDLSQIELTLKDDKYISSLNPADLKILRAAKALKEEWNSLSLLYIHELMFLLKDNLASDMQNKNLLSQVLRQLQSMEFLDPQAIQFLNLIQANKPLQDIRPMP